MCVCVCAAYFVCLLLYGSQNIFTLWKCCEKKWFCCCYILSLRIWLVLCGVNLSFRLLSPVRKRCVSLVCTQLDWRDESLVTFLADIYYQKIVCNVCSANFFPPSLFHFLSIVDFVGSHVALSLSLAVFFRNNSRCAVCFCIHSRGFTKVCFSPSLSLSHARSLNPISLHKTSVFKFFNLFCFNSPVYRMGMVTYILYVASIDQFVMTLAKFNVCIALFSFSSTHCFCPASLSTVSFFLLSSFVIPWNMFAVWFIWYNLRWDLAAHFREWKMEYEWGNNSKFFSFSFRVNEPFNSVSLSMSLCVLDTVLYCERVPI